MRLGAFIKVGNHCITLGALLILKKRWHYVRLKCPNQSYPLRKLLSTPILLMKACRKLKTRKRRPCSRMIQRKNLKSKPSRVETIIDCNRGL